MLESINISGFRKYKDYSVGEFDRINFILGENNVGKTSILEAIFAWACGQNVHPFMNIPLARGRYSGIQNPYWIMEEILTSVYDRYSLPLKMSFEGIEDGKSVKFDHTIYPSDLLKEYDASYKTFATEEMPKTNESSINNPNSAPIVLGMQGIVQLAQTLIAHWEVENNGKVLKTDITIPQSQVPISKPHCQAKFIDLLSHTAIGESVQMYSSLKREKLLQEVVEEIGKVFPEIEGFDMLPYPDGSQAPVSVVKKNGSILPMYAYGDGIQKWFFILGALALYKNSIICIDEIDAGFHPAAQVEFCVNMIQYALKNGVQLFLTTHNIEFMDNFLQAVSDMDKETKDEIRILTLRSVENEVKTRSLNANDTAKARSNYNLELR